MTSIPDLLTGFVIGALLLSGLIYLLPYRSLARRISQYQQELLQVRGSLEETETKLFNQEKRYQIDTQAFKKEKSRLEARVTELEQECADLEHQHTDQQAQWRHEHEQQAQVLQKTRDLLEKAELELIGLKEQLLKDRGEWQQDRENLDMEAQRLRTMVDTLEQTRTALEAQVDEQREAWEQKRLDLDMQVAQARTEMMKLHSKLKDGEVDGDFDILHHHHQSSPQVLQLHAEKLALENELDNQRARAEALEEEINDLMQRMLRADN